MLPGIPLWIAVSVFLGMGIVFHLLQEGLAPLSLLAPFWFRLQNINQWLAIKFRTSARRVLQAELLALGFTLMQIGEWAAAIACWVLLGFTSFAKALGWGSVKDKDNEKSPLLLRLFSAAGALVLCVLLIAITDLRKPDTEPWSNLQRFHIRNPDAAPNYPAPNHPAVRFDGKAEPPSSQMCQGVPDRAKCLCPDSLKYTMKALPTPSDNNYATEVKIAARSSVEPMYHIRVFARTPIRGYNYSASPFGKDQGAGLAQGIYEYDPYSITLQSSRPEQDFTVELHSSEGLGLICVEQEN